MFLEETDRARHLRLKYSIATFVRNDAMTLILCLWNYLFLGLYHKQFKRQSYMNKNLFIYSLFHNHLLRLSSVPCMVRVGNTDSITEVLIIHII